MMENECLVPLVIASWGLGSGDTTDGSRADAGNCDELTSMQLGAALMFAIPRTKMYDSTCFGDTRHT